MASHPILLALPIMLLTMAIVCGDAHRRSLPLRTTIAWTFGVGIPNLAGFGLVFSFDSTLSRQ